MVGRSRVMAEATAGVSLLLPRRGSRGTLTYRERKNV